MRGERDGVVRRLGAGVDDEHAVQRGAEGGCHRPPLVDREQDALAGGAAHERAVSASRLEERDAPGMASRSSAARAIGQRGHGGGEEGGMAEIGQAHVGSMLPGGGIGVDSNDRSERPRFEELDRAMTYVITEPCIGVKDACCVDVCPVDCIHATDDDTMFFIDPDECIDCGACEPECPVTAIFAEDAVPDDQWTNYIQINADYFKSA